MENNKVMNIFYYLVVVIDDLYVSRKLIENIVIYILLIVHT